MSKSSITIKATLPSLNLPPIHPGEILAEELEVLGLSANALAHSLDIPANRIGSILRGGCSITADTALRLGRFFGTSSRFWLNLQMSYDLTIAEQKRGTDILHRVHPLAAVPRQFVGAISQE